MDEDNISRENTDSGSDTEFIAETEPRRSKKRKGCPKTWKRNVAKVSRYRPKGFPSMPPCGHQAGTFQCKELSLQDVRKIHHRFYQHPDKEWQNNFILQHLSVSSPKRCCTPPGNSSRRQVSTRFSLPKKRGNVVKNVRVCRAAFLDILKIGRNGVNRLCQKFLVQGTTPPETRGGDRRSQKYEQKREAVRNHIRSFKPLQKHYCRGKDTHRQYLRSDHSIQKMWSMYNEQYPGEDLNVEYDYYRSIFNDHFNIGFGAPCVDKCSTCCLLENRISAEKSKPERKKWKFQLKAHKKRDDVFYEKLRQENDNELTLSYDCQKNLVLPKIPDQAAYYARQLYLYNFTICEGPSKSPQSKANTFFYIWSENEFRKGSNQIASAVHHRLLNMDLETVTTVRLFYDGCGGQNKNKTVVGMLLHWFLLEAPHNIEKIELMFPLVGHSFILPNRIFGHLEREFNTRSVIANPEEYLNVIKRYGIVTHLGEDAPVKDWKANTDDILNNPGQWHFQFQKAKRFIVTKSKTNKSLLVRGEPFYNFDIGEAKSLCRKGKTFKVAHIPDIPRGVVLKLAKVKDVKRLLVLHFREAWDSNPELEFYVNIFAEQDADTQTLNEDADDVLDDTLDFELMEADETDIA